MYHYDGYISASDLLEYLFCPRFIYFIYCLQIPQHEEKHKKVIKGRELHNLKEKTNREYLRKKLNVKKKEVSVYLVSEHLKMKGIVDEILYLPKGELAPLDYKYARYKGYLFPTHKYQSCFYGLLIKDIYNANVLRGFICFVRSNNLIKEIQLDKKLYKDVMSICNNIHKIIRDEIFPEATNQRGKCIDCCYRNICMRQY